MYGVAAVVTESELTLVCVLELVLLSVFRLKKVRSPFETFVRVLTVRCPSLRTVRGKLMENHKPQTSKCHVTRSCGYVFSWQFTCERQEGLPAVSDLRQGFLPLKFAQPRV